MKQKNIRFGNGEKKFSYYLDNQLIEHILVIGKTQRLISQPKSKVNNTVWVYTAKFSLYPTENCLIFITYWEHSLASAVFWSLV